jgi:hypothetical protein
MRQSRNPRSAALVSRSTWGTKNVGFAGDLIAANAAARHKSALQKLAQAAKIFMRSAGAATYLQTRSTKENQTPQE